MKKYIQKILLGAIMVIIFAIVQFSSLGNIADLKSLDFFRAPHPAHPEVVVLAIDNKSINDIGRWPWSRSVHAQVINKLGTDDPLLVAMDVTFSDPENSSSDTAFANSLNETDFPVVLASQAVFINGQADPQKIQLPLDQFTQSNNVSIGIVNVPLSEDSLARSFPDALSYQSQTYQPFTYQITKLLNAPPPTQDEKFVNYAGPAGTFVTYSVSDVLSGKIGKSQLQGKVILIGATASDLHDTLLTPENPQVMAGIEYHANVIDNILLQRSIKVLPVSYEQIIGGLLLAVFILMIFMMSAKKAAIATAIVILILPVVSFILWRAGIALSYFQNLVLALSFLLIYGLYSWYAAEREKRRLRETFKNYFSPAVMEAIIKDPSLLTLGGRRAQVTVFFSDIRNFTTISESLPPEELATLLNEYFTEMTEEILATDGVVDKFIGDAIMAFWGAPIDQPNQADRAVKASLKMLNKLSILQTKWEKQGYPFVDIGIGIHSGEATVGNMGSVKRFDYTVIGDSVNTASRLEGLNKEYKTNLIISGSTKDLLRTKLNTKRLGKVLVKGKTKGVDIYTIIKN